jgi:hypothetical protein
MTSPKQYACTAAAVTRSTLSGLPRETSSAPRTITSVLASPLTSRKRSATLRGRTSAGQALRSGTVMVNCRSDEVTRVTPIAAKRSSDACGADACCVAKAKVSCERPGLTNAIVSLYRLVPAIWRDVERRLHLAPEHS